MPGAISSCIRPRARRARRAAARALQAKNPTRRGVTVWVETDGTVYWAVPENLVPTHGDGANRNDNKYIDNGPTFHQVVGSNSIGVEFAGNYPDVTRGATEPQIAAWRILVKVLEARYGIPPSGSMRITGSTSRTRAIAKAARWRAGEAVGGVSLLHVVARPGGNCARAGIHNAAVLIKEGRRRIASMRRTGISPAFAGMTAVVA